MQAAPSVARSSLRRFERGWTSSHHGPLSEVRRSGTFRFCDHAAAAVEERRDVPVYVQCYEPVVDPPVPGGWCFVCGDCVRRSDLYELLATIDGWVCEACVLEWADMVKNGFVERAKSMKPEFPPDAPIQGLRRMWRGSADG